MNNQGCRYVLVTGLLSLMGWITLLLLMIGWAGGDGG